MLVGFVKYFTSANINVSGKEGLQGHSTHGPLKPDNSTQDNSTQGNSTHEQLNPKSGLSCLGLSPRPKPKV